MDDSVNVGHATATNETSPTSAEVVQITRADLETAISDAADAAAASMASETGARLDALTADVQAASTGGVVLLDDSQYSQISQLLASDLNGMVVVTGLCALILGAVVATAMTMHWRGSRG